MSRHAIHGPQHDPHLHSKARSTWEILSRVAHYLRPYPWLALGTVSCAILSLACGFAYPRLTQFIIDDVIRAQKPDWLAPAIAGLLTAFLLREVFNSLRIRMNNVFEQNVVYDMRREVYSRLQRLPISYFDQRASGDLMTRVIEDVNSMERVLIDGTEQGTVSILSITGALAFMFATHPTLAWLALAPVPFLIAGAIWYTSTAHQRYRAQRLASSALNALLMDNLQGVRQIKTFGRQTHEDARFSERAGDLRQGTLQVMLAWAKYSPAMAFATSLGTGLVLWQGGRLVMAGSLAVGELVGFVLLLGFFYEPIGRLHGLNQMMQAARAAGERVFDILDTEIERQDRTLSLPPVIQGHVRYDRVSFSYGADRPVLNEISLEALPGQMVALVGPTGAGKSTVVNLLPGFYEIGGGSITIDEQPIARVSLDSLRSNISMVTQEPFLFNGTIRENIMYGRLDATEAELTAASRSAHVEDFVSKLPEGYDTRVGERGVKLSVGEKQRVSIARAILKNAPILILDEATASVDTATEKLIQDALSHLMKGRTSFVIAHRLSTIRNADQILVLKQGKIIERGTHAELVEAGGLYARLCQIQRATFIEERFVQLETP